MTTDNMQESMRGIVTHHHAHMLGPIIPYPSLNCALVHADTVDVLCETLQLVQVHVILLRQILELLWCRYIFSLFEEFGERECYEAVTSGS